MLHHLFLLRPHFDSVVGLFVGYSGNNSMIQNRLDSGPRHTCTLYTMEGDSSPLLMECVSGSSLSVAMPGRVFADLNVAPLAASLALLSEAEVSAVAAGTTGGVEHIYIYIYIFPKKSLLYGALTD